VVINVPYKAGLRDAGEIEHGKRENTDFCGWHGSTPICKRGN